MESITVVSRYDKAKNELQNKGLELLPLLTSRNIDINKYEPIGAGFYHQYEDCFDASVICIDREKFIARQPYIVKIVLEDFTDEEYKRLHKNFEIISNSDYRSYYDLNINTVLMQSDVV
ncbi:hypothetical protein E0W68_12255 [Flavobacterium salilacus subsp. salilacus]|uniref:hypothetical protein n=1 Tax=Flavobacterium TaxID=237 RepID=UPI001074D43F|nr:MULTISPECIES: hypothetical protein [Flavobacterium]KAF2516299.1 hypothetical protein E0W68_12255 [Flavobacterium salilacus subsp. salilacus]MBE1613829.1 hypothetical protein [Flavobacterium sp. SaA2.13]